MKPKNFLLLIIKIKNIHEFNVLRLNLWIFSIEKSNIPHWHTFTMLSPTIKILIFVLLVWSHKAFWMENLNVDVNKKPISTLTL
jgi:hypothetical protein